MKILHCCLAAFYIDNYSYQENILPKMHQSQGHTVMILASTETYLDKTILGYTEPGCYTNEYGIPVIRVPYQKWLPHAVMKKLRFYQGITNVLNKFKPDIIFLHDCQFLSITDIVAYLKRHKNVRVYVDGHTDFINSGTNWISEHIMHRGIYKWCVKQIEPYVRKFYGVLPLRVDFFTDVYKTPPAKTELLIMGADHSIIDLLKRQQIRQSIRKELGINEKDFVIVTGGKIDVRKNIHLLLKAITTMESYPIKLLIFGSPNKEMSEEISEGSKHCNVRYVGWASSELSSKYLIAGDIAFFPGTHSVLWEQAVGLGLPGVFKYWEGMQHVDVGGNCIFMKNISTETIKEIILQLYNDEDAFKLMRDIAMTKGMTHFSYDEIAKRAIEH